jgi:multidrug transporter EmrE-like cation transporter
MNWWFITLISRILSGEPFEKATKFDYRFCFFAFATLPIFVPIGAWLLEKIPNSIQNGRYFGIWLGIGFVFIVTIGVFIFPKIARRTPLFVSIPVAIIAWPVYAWLFWHPEFFHSN